MRRAVALAVTVLLLAPASVPSAQADHPPAPRLQEVMDTWLAVANATLSAATVENVDSGSKDTILSDLALKHRQGRPAELAMAAARAHYFADYLNLTADAPDWDGTNASTRQQTGNAHRLYFLNATDDLKDDADDALGAALAAYGAFSPRTGAGADVAILGATLLVAADISLKKEYNASREKVAVEYVDPDVTTGVYRSAIQTLVFQTAGMVHLTHIALDVLEVAKALDADGGTLLRPTLWQDVVERHAGAVAKPSFTAPGPEQPQLAAFADAAFDDGMPIVGLAGYLEFRAAREKGGDEFRLSHGSLKRAGVLDALGDTITDAELALNETSTHGITGALVQSALADAWAAAGASGSTSGLIAAQTSLEVSLALHRELVVAVGAAGDDDGLPTLAIVAGGLILVAGLGVVLMRRRGGAA